ncbi:MAG: S26 family signal peptidase [Alphaproteobacteria bacterium]|nr:S26 family signal peptidase [Alphaproteobacteria bacterium]
MLLSTPQRRTVWQLGLSVTASVVVALAWPRPPRIIWNATASAPIGLYAVLPVHNLAPGQLVLARLPPKAARLAARRGYLPLGLPVVKRVVALAGARICAHGHILSQGGHVIAYRLFADSRRRPLPLWNGCLRLSEQEAFLLMAGKRHSFDSRYFGPVRRAAIIGRLVPLWLR